MSFEKPASVLLAEQQVFDAIAGKIVEMIETLNAMKLTGEETGFVEELVEKTNKLLSDGLNTIGEVAPHCDRTKMANAVIYLLTNIGQIGSAASGQLKARRN